MKVEQSFFGWAWIWRVLKKKRLQLAAILLATLVGYGLSLAVPILIQQAVDRIVRHQIDHVLALFALLAVLVVVGEIFLVKWRLKVVVDVGLYLDRRILRLFFLRFMSAKTNARGTIDSAADINKINQIAKIQDFILKLVPNILFEIGTAFFAFWLIVHYSPVVAIAIVGIAFVFGLQMRRKINEIYLNSGHYYQALSQRDAVLNESIIGFSTIKSIGGEFKRYLQWAESVDKTLGAISALSANSRSHMMLSGLCGQAVILTVVLTGCYLIVQGTLTVGGLLAMQLLASKVVSPVLNSGNVIQQIQELRVALRELKDFFAQPLECAITSPATTKFDRAGGILIKSLSMQYEGVNKPALIDINVSLPSRGVVVIVGKNGCGKTTLVRSMTGLLRDYTGSIFWGATNVLEYHPRLLRKKIGIVNQDNMLFKGSVRHNLQRGSLPIAEEFLWEALRFTSADRFVLELPGGLDHLIDDAGRNLSAGQRQRIAISRAVAENPQILILDEPTSFLDAEAALGLEDRLLEWGKKGLCIIVTHNMKTAAKADMLLVLDAGQVVGVGRHEELVVSCSVYQSLCADYS